MPSINPVVAFFRAAAAQRGFSIRGLPLIPKTIWPSAPYHRTNYNQFISWISRLQLSAPTWVIDVGANHGDFSQAATTLFPGVNILLVEPLPLLHAELVRRSEEPRYRWQVAKCALGSSCGVAPLHVDPNSDGISSLAGFSERYRQVNSAVRPGEAIDCQVRTLDDLCAEHEITNVDLLKIDVEGFEFEVFKGATTTLRQTKALIVELSLIRRTEEEDALAEMLAQLRNYKFHLVDLLPSYYDPREPWRPVEFNVLARKNG